MRGQALLLFLWIAGAAHAGTEVKTSAVKASDLPTGVTVRGELVRGVTFTDKNGTNYLLFGRAFDKKKNSFALYVEDWVVPAKGAPKNLLPVRDFTEAGCPLGPSAIFHDAATTVTDLDGDGIAEVTFAYQLACRSDVSPATYKLLVIENGTKLILRGQTTVDPGDGVLGGAFKADPAEAKWPAAFLAHAKKTWTATTKDLE